MSVNVIEEGGETVVVIEEDIGGKGDKGDKGDKGTPGHAIIQPEPPDPTNLPDGTTWVDEDSEVGGGEAMLPESGGTITGDLTVEGDMAVEGTLTVSAPVNPTDASSKAYVDSHSSIITGTDEPTADDGEVGNYFLDTNHNVLYGPKAVGSATPVTLFTDEVPTLEGPASEFGGQEYLGNQLRFDVPGTVIGLRFYKSELDPRSEVYVQVWRESLTGTGAVPISLSEPSGWHESSFDNYDYDLSFPVDAGETIKVTQNVEQDGFASVIESVDPLVPFSHNGMTSLGVVLSDDLGHLPGDPIPNYHSFIDVIFQPRVWPVAMAGVGGDRTWYGDLTVADGMLLTRSVYKTPNGQYTINAVSQNGLVVDESSLASFGFEYEGYVSTGGDPLIATAFLEGMVQADANGADGSLEMGSTGQVSIESGRNIEVITSIEQEEGKDTGSALNLTGEGEAYLFSTKSLSVAVQMLKDETDEFRGGIDVSESGMEIGSSYLDYETGEVHEVGIFLAAAPNAGVMDISATTEILIGAPDIKLNDGGGGPARLGGVASPDNWDDAANKQYVDDAIAAALAVFRSGGAE